MQLYNGDCLEVLKTLPYNSVDSVVTDPPAGIAFMGKKWDEDKGGRDNWIKWMETISKECLRVLKPGGHALVWALPRTSHWTATAWENAGFEVRDRVSHIFSSGFPKSMNVSKAIDREAGAVREVIGTETKQILEKGRGHGRDENGTVINKGLLSESLGNHEVPITKPATEKVKQFAGFGTALKPAAEDWWLLRKPIEEKTVASNVIKYGTGALNIDACRIETEDKLGGGSCSGSFHASEGWDRPWMHNEEIKESKTAESIEKVKKSELLGRWPANIIHDGSEEVLELFPETKSSKGKPRVGEKSSDFFIKKVAQVNCEYSDSGSAARFFYCSKANKADKNEGLDDFESQEREDSGNNQGVRICKTCGLTDNGSNDHSACLGEFEYKKCFPIKNTHPTIKSTKLMRYLCKLITPPQGIILDPFLGSGSTGKAAILEGFDFIGIEKETEYFNIAEARINAVMPQPKTEQLTLGV